MANRASSLDLKVHSIDDLRRLGTEKLGRNEAEFYNEGAMDLISLRENVEAYRKYKIRPRVLVNVAQVDTSTEIFGCKVRFPLGIGPAAMHKLAHSDGEIATCRAAASMGICMGLSSYSTTSLEDVAEAAGDTPLFIQMCVLKDRSLTQQLLRRAEAQGYKALFLSVDVPVLGRRLNEMRNNFTLPAHLKFPNILSDALSETAGENSRTAFDATLDWQNTIPWLRQNTTMEIWLKGILTPEDVSLAIDWDIDGVVISNHGGRQLDDAPATLDALRICAPVAAGKLKIAVDGGIRRGSDIFKALALGAQHCFVGRIALWGLAYDGQRGVELGIELLYDEFVNTMQLAGCRSIKDITKGHLSILTSDSLLSKL